MAGVGRSYKRPKHLDFNGFGDRQCIFQFDPERPDGAVHFCVPKQQLDCA